MKLAMVGNVKGWRDAVVLVAEQQKDATTGYWKPIAATEEKLPIELEDDYQGHFMFNGKVYPIDLNPAKVQINELLQRSIKRPALLVTHYKGCVDEAGNSIERTIQEFRPVAGEYVDCVQPDGQTLRIWPILYGDNVSGLTLASCKTRLFMQYTMAKDMLGGML